MGRRGTGFASALSTDGAIQIRQLGFELGDLVLQVEQHAVVQGFEFAVDGAQHPILFLIGG